MRLCVYVHWEPVCVCCSVSSLFPCGNVQVFSINLALVGPWVIDRLCSPEEGISIPGSVPGREVIPTLL